MRRFRTPATIMILFVLLECVFMERNRDDGDVDLSKATPLIAQAVPLPASAKPLKPGQTEVPPHALFNNKPGKFMSLTSLMGAVDPTGTTLPLDFDGDGILNTDETTTSIWVADYPVVDATIAPPVTMKIEILKSDGVSTSEITSNISASDMESRKNEGTEKVHVDEVNTRTAQFQDSIKTANSNSVEFSRKHSFSATMCGGYQVSCSGGQVGSSSGGGAESAGGMMSMGAGLGLSGNVSSGQSANWSNSSSFAATTTKWADRPFANNLDRTAKSVKTNSAEKIARKYRKDKKTQKQTEDKIKADAGFVRAALYIENFSVNMPVKISNVLCSLMFETPDGQLIPVQSFRLRNDDYSLFEIEVYGGNRFGPYVVELGNLNTVEIEKALQNGYTPRIFIVDYKMTHVADSNYRSQLLHFSGDNLKVVEENAKGRTALVKLIGPNVREMYRVAAFDTDATGDVCSAAGVTSVSPGVSLRKVLERMGCAGMNIEFGNYIIDMKDLVPQLKENKIFVAGIKNLAGVPTRVPCETKTENGTDGVSRTACVAKSLDQWTQQERDDFGIWVVFANGKYYNHSEYVNAAGQKVLFRVPGIDGHSIPVLRGIDSTVWAGDKFDLVYLRAADFSAALAEYGTNPLQTGKEFKVNTKWDLSDLGPNPFLPDQKSVYLGTAGLGEKIELKFDLTKTILLNPTFGPAQTPASGAPYLFTDAAYDIRAADRRYNLSEVLDFEISLGLGGTPSDWIHVLRDAQDSPLSNQFGKCGINVDYANQEFTVCLRLPETNPLVVDELGLVSLFLRPRLNSAYRNTVWPLPYADVRQYRGTLSIAADAGATELTVRNPSGVANVGDTVHFEGLTTTHVIAAVGQASEGLQTITLTTALAESITGGTPVFIHGGLTQSQFVHAIDTNPDLYVNWPVPAGYLNNWSEKQNVPLSTGVGPGSCGYNGTDNNTFVSTYCLGFTPDVHVGNWVGYQNFGNPLWNYWNDASLLVSFEKGGKRYLRYRPDLDNVQAFSTNPEILMNSTLNDQVAYDMAGDNGRAIATWTANTGGNLYARFRIYDIANDQVVGAGETTFAVFTSPGHPWVGVRPAVSGDRALLNWSDPVNNVVRYQVIDMTNGAQVGAQTTVYIASYDIAQTLSVADGSRGLVVWTRQVGANMEVVGRFVDLTTGTMLGTSRFNITSAPDAVVTNTVWHTKAKNGKVVIHWTTSAPGNYTLRSTVIDMQADPVSGNPIVGTAGQTVATSTTAAFGANRVEIDNGRALLSWHLNGDAFARRIDMSNGQFLDNGPMHVNSGMPSVTASQAHAVDADLGLFAVPTIENGACVLWVRRIDMTNGQVVGTPIEVARGLDLACHSVTVHLSPFRALVLWHGENTGQPSKLYARGIDLVNNRAMGQAPLRWDITGPLMNGPYIPNERHGNRVFAIWRESPSNNNTQNFRGRSMPFDFDPSPQYGLNNFFTAPLIERDYKVQARILSE